MDVRANKKEIISKILNKINYNKVYENPYKLCKKFKNIPNEIAKKFKKKDLIIKKCTI